MKSSILTLFLSLILGTTLAHGATLFVHTGQDLQSVIDSANTGDIVNLLPGSHDGNLSVTNKDLTIRGAGNQMANISNISAIGSNVILQKLRMSSLITGIGNGSNKQVIVSQCEIGNIDANTSHTIIQYSKVARLYAQNQVTITGCEFEGNNDGGIGIDLDGSSVKALIQNSRIHSYKLDSLGDINQECIGIRVRNGASARIVNNLIHGCKDRMHNGNETNSGFGIFIGPASSAFIYGNILWDCYVSRYYTHSDNPTGALICSFGQATISHNILWQFTPDIYEGGHTREVQITLKEAQATHSILADPKFTDLTNGNFTLASNSPAINAGPPDPQYNDRDGSRNDIGMFGGHNFIPDGRTTDKPIVLGLDVAPIAVPVGGTVTIESTGATVK